jgi:hypothetical protein
VQSSALVQPASLCRMLSMFLKVCSNTVRIPPWKFLRLHSRRPSQKFGAVPSAGADDHPINYDSIGPVPGRRPAGQQESPSVWFSEVGFGSRTDLDMTRVRALKPKLARNSLPFPVPICESRARHWQNRQLSLWCRCTAAEVIAGNISTSLQSSLLADTAMRLVRR